jgi:drug/metabolite transporter superfamily protein YnfA
MTSGQIDPLTSIINQHMFLGAQIVNFSTSIFLRAFGVLSHALDSGIIIRNIVLCTLLVLPLVHVQACSVHAVYGGVYILLSTKPG